MKRKILSLAVQSALGLAMAGSILPGVAFAQDDEKATI
ncbi:MAG: hypothetical protein ACI9Y1_002890 [Lentisphaeria bacterium]|jgi:hypothetical protein